MTGAGNRLRSLQAISAGSGQWLLWIRNIWREAEYTEQPFGRFWLCSSEQYHSADRRSERFDPASSNFAIRSDPAWTDSQRISSRHEHIRCTRSPGHYSADSV